jgi:hypothetical protein
MPEYFEITSIVNCCLYPQYTAALVIVNFRTFIKVLSGWS